MNLPTGFLFGAATSAYQIEGAVAADGRLPSIWDDFCRVPGAVAGGDTGHVACEHYHRWREDISLMERLGLDAYRFSVAWPRVIPRGAGAVNGRGLDFYDRLVDGLLAARIRPFVTLYHWDLPSALQERGGWPSRDIARHFADYAAVVAARLGDRVTDWTTINEPLCTAWIGHLEGRFAPGVRDVRQAVHAAHHLLLAHGLGAAAIRANASATPSIGLVNNLSTIEPASDRAADVRAAARADGHVNRWWLDPAHGRGYPADMIEVYGVEPPVREGDLETIAAPVEYAGLNYYFRQVVVHDPSAPVPHIRQVPVPGARLTAMGWESHAEGLAELLHRLATEYAALRIYVTENGSAWDDKVRADGSIDDQDRVAYLEDHLAAVARAARAGAPVKGYFVWSLLDNFEWAHGLGKRFGLVHVDYATQQRTVKVSGNRYAEIIRAHRSTPRGVSWNAESYGPP